MLWLKHLCVLKNRFFKFSLSPAGTERPEDVPLWSCFGLDVPDHNKTKIGRIRSLIYFGSAMPDIHLESENIETFT